VQSVALVVSDPYSQHVTSDQTQHSAVGSRRVLIQSVLAVALPASLAVFANTETFASLAEAAVATTLTIWLSIIAASIAAIGEFVFLASLARIVIARGSLQRYHDRQSDPTRIRRVRHFRFALATVALTLVASFILLETAFRLFSIVPPEGKFPRGEVRFDVDNSVNALGLREPWETIAPDDTRKRIAFLGDSFVYGYAVDREKTFTSLVEQTLPDTITINMGQAGTNPKGQYHAFMKLKDQVQPDILVHVIYLNDLDFYLGDLLKGIHFIPRTDSWLATQSRVVRYLEKTWQARQARVKTIAYFSGGETQTRREESWREFRKYVRLTKQATEDVGAEYLLVVFPWLYRLDNYPLTNIHEKMRAFAKELNVPMLDLLDTFKNRNATELRVNDMDSHPNPAAHRIAASAICDFIENH